MKAQIQVTQSSAAQHITGQALYLYAIGVASRVHLIIPTIIRGSLVFCRACLTAIAPKDCHRLPDDAVSIFVAHFNIEVMFAPRLLLILPLCFDQSPILLAGGNSGIVNSDTKLIESGIPGARGGTWCRCCCRNGYVGCRGCLGRGCLRTATGAGAAAATAS